MRNKVRFARFGSCTCTPLSEPDWRGGDAGCPGDDAGAVQVACLRPDRLRRDRQCVSCLWTGLSSRHSRFGEICSAFVHSIISAILFISGVVVSWIVSGRLSYHGAVPAIIFLTYYDRRLHGDSVRVRACGNRRRRKVNMSGRGPSSKLIKNQLGRSGTCYSGNDKMTHG